MTDPSTPFPCAGGELSGRLPTAEPRSKPVHDSLDLLFACHVRPDYECRCGTPGNYCAAHGTYEPPSRDDEVLSAVAEAARPSRSGNRVIRKRLEN